jgi:hypothetical protein
VGIVVLVECPRYGMVFQSCIAAGDASDAKEEKVVVVVVVVVVVEKNNKPNPKCPSIQPSQQA